MNLSNYLKAQLLNHTIKGMTYTPVATVYVGLMSDLQNEGDTYTEIAIGGYARHEVSFVEADAGQISNLDVIFDVATADWGAIEYIGIFDSPVVGAGNLLWWGQLAEAKFVSFSAVFKILAGQIVIALTDSFSLHLRNNMLNLVLRNQAFASPSNIYASVGANISDDYSSLVEPPGVTRQLVGFSSVGTTEVTCPAALGGISFIAGTDWGLISHVGLYDAETNGNLLFALPFTTIRNILSGDGLEFDADSITLSVV